MWLMFVLVLVRKLLWRGTWSLSPKLLVASLTYTIGQEHERKSIASLRVLCNKAYTTSTKLVSLFLLSSLPTNGSDSCVDCLSI